VAVEAIGRRALLASFVGALERAVREALPAWSAASFRAWHAAQLGHDLHWDPRCRFLAALEPAIAAAARCSSPLVIAGSDGAGRRTLARCILFRGASEPRDLAATHGGCLVDLDPLSPAEQRALARRAGDQPDERLVLLTTASVAAVRCGGALVPELAALVDPLPLAVPPLADRRDEIPGLVEVIAADVGRAEGLRAVRFDELALAELWRQEWRGSVRELRAITAQLARLHGGEVVARDDVRAVLRSRGLQPRERLPSLRPRRLDLEFALATTRHKNGAFNHARAARYLGWDPDTLAARLRAPGAKRSE
jgi:DNA-binding NtrC family response regulator